MNCLGGKPKRFKFVAYGRLGNLDGLIESGNDKITAFADTKIYTQNNPEVFESIARIFPINNSRENVKEGMRGEPLANNSLFMLKIFYYLGLAARKTVPRKKKPLPLLTSAHPHSEQESTLTRD